jgi:hypothetical protein
MRAVESVDVDAGLGLTGRGGRLAGEHRPVT